MSEDEINPWNVGENLKTSKDFIKMLYGNKNINWWLAMMKGGGGIWIFLENETKELNDDINDLYGRLRILEFSQEQAAEVIRDHGAKILMWKELYKKEVSGEEK